MVMEGNLTLGGECIMQYTCNILWNCTLEHLILLTNVTPINLIKKMEARNVSYTVFKTLVIRMLKELCKNFNKETVSIKKRYKNYFKQQ